MSRFRKDSWMSVSEWTVKENKQLIVGVWSKPLKLIWRKVTLPFYSCRSVANQKQKTVCLSLCGWLMMIICIVLPPPNHVLWDVWCLLRMALWSWAHVQGEVDCTGGNLEINTGCLSASLQGTWAHESTGCCWWGWQGVGGADVPQEGGEAGRVQAGDLEIGKPPQGSWWLDNRSTTARAQKPDWLSPHWPQELHMYTGISAHIM